MRRYLEHFLDLCKNRIFVMLCGVIVLFAIIVLRLFSLQIIHGEYYDESITASVSKTLPVAASRGNIYDRYGRPLAVNTVAYCVQVDGSVTLELNREERKTLATDLTDWLWADGHHKVDSLPITTSSPYSFTFKGTDEEKEKQEKSWKASIGLEKKQYKLSATECLKYLYEKYDVPEGYTAVQKRTYLSLAMSDDRNLMALTLARKLSEFGETIDDELPLDTEAPYAFQFNGNTNREKSWKQSMLMKGKELNYNSRKTLDYLRDFFGLPEGLPEQLVRDTLGIRYSLYLKRYQQYQTVTIATDISDKTLAYVEENQDTFPNVVIDTVSLRDYPEGEYFSHILGYIRQMTESDYALYKDEVDADGNPLYSQTDVVGQDGMEKLYEKELNGVDGKVLIEVDNQGRRMSVIDSTEPVAGKDVFLTLDSKLQKVAYDTLESELRTAVLRKLTGGGKTYASSTELFTSMININHISAQKMIQAEDGVQKQVYQKLKQANPTFNPDATTSQTRWTDGDTIRTAIGQSINSYTPAQITKYVSTLANGGTLYKLHMVDHIQNADGTLHSEVEETVENVTKFKEENLQAVYQGMYLVTNGSHGTLRTAFNDLPVKVAAKTGTAEEDKNRSSHTWFVCFAPFDDPQIAITVMIPFGEGSGTPAPAVAKAIIREYLGLDYTPTNTTMQTVLAE